jgi:hypothetical protein
MITKDDAIFLLLEASPSFQAKWDEYEREQGDQRLYYTELGLFADHLLDLYQKGKVEDFSAVFAVVERLHIEGEPYIKEAATIGLLEGLQNIAGNSGIDTDEFIPFLLPETLRWWNNLNCFWSDMSRSIAPEKKRFGLLGCLDRFWSGVTKSVDGS